MKSYGYILQPGGNEELFYSQSGHEAQCIGHLRGDFGRDGDEFWTTWWPHEAHDQNTSEFKQEFQGLMNTLRTGVLKNLPAMRKYLKGHPAPLTEDAGHTSHGYHIQTTHYAYYLRCTPAVGDYNFYLYCYAKGDEPTK